MWDSVYRRQWRPRPHGPRVSGSEKEEYDLKAGVGVKKWDEGEKQVSWLGDEERGLGLGRGPGGSESWLCGFSLPRFLQL